MLGALEDCARLDGAEGHNLRFAIAAKARSIGMTTEATATLSQHQPDYDYGISLSKAEEAWGYDYQAWSCETLRDRCGDLVKRYCRMCPFAQGVVTGSNNQAEA